ncbi:hypothetical protein SAMN04489712_10275 [Thermomonospora echinospora]|uniref:Uncharacterized protein n=1 Tax=Thermomonospora echinospora TaxID=1992 RepID=A0A1H5UXJ5_9ACTN|nr:hypothetical protein [Thermomonospora echinospora]SEF79694.1 hypothetical protein SAMN04489712_10275 [Thermomonospora echinospora]
MTPIEERLREVLDEHSVDRPVPSGLAERAERRGRRIRRRRRAGGAALAAASVTAAVAVGTAWVAPQPAEHAGQVASAPSTAPPAPAVTVSRGGQAPPDGRLCAKAAIRTENGRVARLVLSNCSQQEAARLKAKIIQQCPQAKDGLHTSEAGDVQVTGADLVNCALKALGVAKPPAPPR